jgi:alpha-galactosidase/6-phospho-beta-glucosidase family protein
LLADDSHRQLTRESELPKIAFIGAGSTVFARNMIGDILSFPELAGAMISLHDIGVPTADINYLCAGINHMAFYLRLERNGEDLYPLIRRVVEEGRVPDWNRVRYELFVRTGYFVTESSEHLNEYVPWFIKRDRPDLVERFNIALDEYITRCED